mmetsp:Transcript_74630/g.205765  ORF Transcript_74630/g.205765 Transcript_74630/m.205765 type:complete len:236 (-) Transcript_74630:1148-1855(-)
MVSLETTKFFMQDATQQKQPVHLLVLIQGLYHCHNCHSCHSRSRCLRGRVCTEAHGAQRLLGHKGPPLISCSSPTQPTYHHLRRMPQWPTQRASFSESPHKHDMPLPCPGHCCWTARHPSRAKHTLGYIRLPEPAPLLAALPWASPLSLQRHNSLWPRRSTLPAHCEPLELQSWSGGVSIPMASSPCSPWLLAMPSGARNRGGRLSSIGPVRSCSTGARQASQTFGRRSSSSRPS